MEASRLCRGVFSFGKPEPFDVAAWDATIAAELNFKHKVKHP